MAKLRESSKSIIVGASAKWDQEELLGLWTDLRKLKKAEFQVILLDIFSGPRKEMRSVTRRRGGNAVPRSGQSTSTASRIVALLLGGRMPDERAARERMRMTLSKLVGGIIDREDSKRFEAWISGLLDRYDPGTVMRAAMEAAEEA